MTMMNSPPRIVGVACSAKRMTPLTAATLPRVEAVTGVRLGLPELTSAFYAEVGRWLDANNAQISGPVRELFVQVPDPAKGVEPIVEVQFPIQPRTVPVGR
jgi:hypothetical protein